MKVRIKIGIVSVMIAFLSFRSISEPTLFSVPDNFPKPVYHFDSNSITKAGVELGKTLFYDALLSSDNTISCGSCHQQSAGFTQHGHVLSHGVNDRLGRRNAMPLFNLAWSNSFGWDGSVSELDSFAIMPITNPLEMDESFDNILEKLRSSTLYPAMFEKTFGTSEISSERLLKALSQFMVTMVSANSKYDRYIRNEGVKLTETELEGLTLFKQKCASCHSGDLFTDFSFRNNGLIMSEDDKGRFEVTKHEIDRYKFKVPSLRNLTYSAPYMHDGRFTSLEEVLEHYASKVVNSPSLDALLEKDGKPGIPLSTNEQQKIIAFLKTLDDEDFIRNVSFSESTLVNEIPRKDIDTELKDFRITDVATRVLFNKSIDAYLAIKSAIEVKNSVQAAEAERTLIKNLNRIRITDTGQKGFFENYQQKLFLDAKRIIEGENFYAHQLDYFDELSAHLYVLIASFKVNEKVLYYSECLKSEAKWLSDSPNDTSVSVNCNDRQTKILKY